MIRHAIDQSIFIINFVKALYLRLLIKKKAIKKWPFLSKESIAEKLVFEIINYFEGEIK